MGWDGRDGWDGIYLRILGEKGEGSQRKLLLMEHSPVTFQSILYSIRNPFSECSTSVAL